MKKALKKQKRCTSIIQQDCNVQTSDLPTCFLAVLNVGVSNGLSEEQILSTAGVYGRIKKLLMFPKKSYCFMECETARDAENIYQSMHGCSAIGQKGAVVYLAYFQNLPLPAMPEANNLPPGLYVIVDFVSPEEEDQLLQAIATPRNEFVGELKHRRVKHFGYEFLYDVNNVNVNQPLPHKIPSICDSLWPRLQRRLTAYGETVSWHVPDQMTVNEYAPGEGIPPHVDTHSAFLDPILSLSLQSDIIMDFRRNHERVPVLLPRRSLLVMIGEARYDWTHGITPKMIDIVPSETGGITTVMRKMRTSLTFRRLRREACHCNYPTLCDTRQQLNNVPTPQLNDKEARELEVANVHNVYNSIAKHFSATRHSPWPQVANFLESFASGSVVIDIGCGNGKYLGCKNDILMIGCDRSYGLLDACRQQTISSNAVTKNLFQCDCLQVPLRSNSVDGCISIAVIHHLATTERRLTAIREVARILRPGGRALIYVWARDQHADTKKSTYLLQNKAVNKQRVTIEQQRQLTKQHYLETNSATFNLPVHTNRTEFEQQDVLVPWKMKKAYDSDSTFLRYYHVFEENELSQLVLQLPGVSVLHSYYDQGNHCVIITKDGRSDWPSRSNSA